MVGVAWFYSKVKGVFEKTLFFIITHANHYALGHHLVCSGGLY